MKKTKTKKTIRKTKGVQTLATVTAKAGRPTIYCATVHPEKAMMLALMGAIDADIARIFSISEVTLNAWKNENPEFLKALNDGKENADAHISHALYHRAKGYEHDDEELKVVDKEVVRVKVRKKYPPDPTSMIFWLKNRQPKRWRDKVDVEQVINPDVLSILKEIADRGVIPGGVFDIGENK